MLEMRSCNYFQARIKDMINMFLYLLKFQKREVMKIGIAKNIKRIEHLRNVYNDLILDIENSKMVIGNNDSDIKLLEKQLLQDYCDFLVLDDLSGRDGYTELRNGEIFDLVIRDVNDKITKFPSKKLELLDLIIPDKLPKTTIKKDPEASRKIATENLKNDRLDSREYSLISIKFFEKNKYNIIDVKFDNHGFIEFKFINQDLNMDFKYLNVTFPTNCDPTKSFGYYRLINGYEINATSRVFATRINIAHIIKNKENQLRWEIEYIDLIWFTKKIFKIIGIKFDYYEYIYQSHPNKIANKSLADCSFIKIEEHSILNRL